jgi:hypothetical protein
VVTAMTAPTLTAADTPTVPCPPWCGWDRCDGFHLSAPTYAATPSETEQLDVSLMRDDLDGPGDNRVLVNITTVGRTGVCVDLTPAGVIDFMATLRRFALTAAGPDGMPMPVEQVQIGDQIRVGDRWETVKGVMVDGWLEEGHPRAVAIDTDAHDPDSGDDYRYPLGAPLIVRQAVTE